MYNKRAWLKSENSPSTSSVAAFHGKAQWGKKPEEYTFLEISDCNGKIRLHKIASDSMNDFIAKLKTLEDSVQDFRKYLEGKS